MVVTLLPPRSPDLFLQQHIKDDMERIYLKQMVGNLASPSVLSVPLPLLLHYIAHIPGRLA